MLLSLRFPFRQSDEQLSMKRTKSKKYLPDNDHRSLPNAAQNFDMGSAQHRKRAKTKSGDDTNIFGLEHTDEVAAHTELQENMSAELLSGQHSELKLRQISHDLNNYLTILMIHCDELKSDFSDSEQRRARIDLLQDNLRLAASIVNELSFPHDRQASDFMSLESFFQFLNTQRAVWNLLTGGAMQINLDMSFEMPASQQIQIVPNYAKRALIQLVRNSAEAAFSNSEAAEDPILASSSPSLDIWFEIQHSEILLHMQDNGPGIPPYLKNSLFEPGNSSRDGRQRGHGLSSASQLAALWGGSIDYVDSTIGAHFSLSFPIKTFNLSS